MKLPNSVLLIDDEKIIRRTYAAILRKMGVKKVITAEDGETGFRKYSEENIDFVILDIRMPRRDGIEVLKQIKAINPEATVLMHSSVTSRPLIEECIDCGAYSFLLKTNNYREFQEKLAEVFSKKKVYWHLSRTSPARLTAQLEQDLVQYEEEDIADILREIENQEQETVAEETIVKPKRPSFWRQKIDETVSESEG